MSTYELSKSATRRPLALPSPRAGTCVLDEPASKALLDQWGINTPERRVATSLSQLAEQAEALFQEQPGPFVLKAVLPGVQHKTELGAVHGPLHSVDAALRVGEELLRSMCDRLLIERWIPAYLELLVSWSRHEVFGPMITIGHGGGWVEALRDVRHALAPVDRDEASRLVGELNCTTMLRQPRRQENSIPDDSLVTAIVEMSRAGTLVADILEVEVNPLGVYPDGQVIALDAVVTKRA